MARFAGCLFDMDGLLLDTERVGLDAFVSVMGQEGVATGLAEAFYRRVIGTSGDATRAALFSEFPAAKGGSVGLLSRWFGAGSCGGPKAGPGAVSGRCGSLEPRARGLRRLRRQ